MSLNRLSLALTLSLPLLGCAGHQNGGQLASSTAVQPPSASQVQNPQPQSPVISPTPELEVSFGKGLKVVHRTFALQSELRRYRIEVVYPQIEGSKSRSIHALNRKIKNLVTKRYQWLLIPVTKEERRHYEKWPGVFNSVDVDYEVVLATDNLLSIYFDMYSYGIGAAHSVQESFTVNFDLRSEKPLQLADLFKPDSGHLKFISDYCFRELSKDHQYLASDEDFKKELAPTPKIYASWNITKEGLRMNFDACRINGCAAGKMAVTIAFDALKERLAEGEKR